MNRTTQPINKPVHLYIKITTMKNVYIPLILLAVLFSCNKTENKSGDLQYVETVPGGCALEEALSFKSITENKDTVTYTVSGDDLNITVGFNATCCGEYNTSSTISNDTIYMDIETSQPGMCNCICYYTYDFKYSGISGAYVYKAHVDDYLFFEGLIKP